MTLKQLEAFYWAATCSSFAIAAQRLHLSLSSLSKRISELEESLGEALFDRAGHRAALTDAGSRLVPKARELLRAADELRTGIGSKAAGLHGTCRFGVGELTALTWLPRLVKALRQQHPGLALEPYVSYGEALEQRVDAGELDFAIIAGRSSRSSIASQPIADAAFAWCASPQIAGRTRSLNAAMLAQWPLVGLPRGAGTTRIVDDWLAAQKAEAPPQRIDCNHVGGVANMLIEGVGIGLLPEGWARSLQRRGVLKLLKSEPGLASLRYAYQWRRDDSRPLIAATREIAASTADFRAGGVF